MVATASGSSEIRGEQEQPLVAVAIAEMLQMSAQLVEAHLARCRLRLEPEREARRDAGVGTLGELPPWTWFSKEKSWRALSSEAEARMRSRFERSMRSKTAMSEAVTQFHLDGTWRRVGSWAWTRLWQGLRRDVSSQAARRRENLTSAGR